MVSAAEERLVTVGYSQHKSQWARILAYGPLMHYTMLNQFTCYVLCHNNRCKQPAPRFLHYILFSFDLKDSTVLLRRNLTGNANG